MALRPPARWANRCHVGRRRQWFLLLVAAVAALLLAVDALHAAAAVLRRANALGRRCLPEPGGAPAGSPRPRIAMVSFSDEAGAAAAGGGLRSFKGVMEEVGGNKREYAERMGYDFVDARGLVDSTRPPSWSKILAVRSLLPRYDWVFWNDADTIITNPSISLENVLHAAIGRDDLNASFDLVVTEDFGGVNAGVFFVRRSNWSEKFLDTWWNQTTFVRFGSTKSGDNDAMKYLIYNLSPEESQHVHISSMQCLFNSYPWFPTWKSAYRFVTSPQTTWKGAYSDGDFMVHLAGIDEKKEWVAKILGELGASKVPSPLDRRNLRKMFYVT